MFRFVPVFICTGTLVAALLPYALFGTQALVFAHDNLDANFVWGVVLAREGQIFAGGQDIVTPILGGLERQFIGSPYQLYFWLFDILSPFGALVATEALTRIIAFVGSYVLMTSIVLRSPIGNLNALLCSLIAACFASLSFWPPGGATVAGFPLFLWAALMMRRSWPNSVSLVWIVFGAAVFVLFGSLVFTGVFALLLTSFVIVMDITRRLFGCAIRLAIFNAVVSIGFIWQNNWLLLLSSSDVLNTRSELVASSWPGSQLPGIITDNFINGQYHADPGTAWPLFVTVGIAVILAPILMHLQRQRYQRSVGALVIALCVLALTASLYGVYRWEVVRGVLTGTFLSGFNFGRFHWLQPGLWAIAFGASLFILRDAIRWRGAGYGIAMTLALAQLIVNFQSLPVYAKPSNRVIAYDSFFAPELFAELRNGLAARGEPVRLGMVGMHPAIAQYNGFDTVGGYVQLYPLETKHLLRRIMAAELGKSESLARYFDEWGNRAYLFVADLEACKGSCFAARAPMEIEALFDMEAFRDFGGTHIAATSRLTNAQQLGLVLIGTYESQTAFERHKWRLHLYAVKQS